ncbi:hypothetical protein NM208_g942 [Fusarium decemcellulare]|uniref:Uncharacterized protein n=1 Tax=Fusarium decemcellulare TaxID=57161 RepID=A0ACC1SXX4_9HYPO|nr:hypothetical protein NM208_g942 [Fusarium decemcellulare]
MPSMLSVQAGQAEVKHTGFEQNILEGECAISQVGLGEVSDHKFGVWQVSPGVFTSTWEDWEAFTIVSGRGTLVDGSGKEHVLVAGALVLIPPGSTGTWRIDETVRKTYVYPASSIER